MTDRELVKCAICDARDYCCSGQILLICWLDRMEAILKD